MKNIFKTAVFLGTFIFLVACQQTSQATPLPVQPPEATFTSTVTPVPSPTATATLAPTSTSTYIVPTLLPTIDPESVPNVLSKAFSLQRLTSSSGYNIQQITGWEYGFGGVSGPYQSYLGYYWLDASHLLLYPRLGEQVNGFSGGWEDVAFQPAVINLENGAVWLPDKGRVYWSSESGMLIDTRFTTSAEGDEGQAVYINTFDGESIAYYPGSLTGVSPSRTKILIDNRWIDLKSGKTVAFNWENDFEEEYDIYFPQPLWSSDETQVYACCYKYGNARTGESFTFPPDELSVDGEKFEGSLNHSDGEWVLNDSHLLIQFDFFNSLILDFIPLYDLKARTLHNLNILAGIPTNKYGPNCDMVFAAPDGQWVWASCYSGDYLVDLSTFESVEYQYPTNSFHDYPSWSADSDFAWMESEPRQLLSVHRKTLSSLPVEPFPYSKLWWHPTDSILAYLSKDDRKLVLLDAQTMFPQEVTLSIPFQELAWSPDGDRIALLAKDGSLWQIRYPVLGNAEQLAEPRSDARDVFWSPDEQYVAYVGGSDIYIVDTIK